MRPEHQYRKHQYKPILPSIANSGDTVPYTARVGQFKLSFTVLRESIAYPYESKNALGRDGLGSFLCSDEFVAKVVKYSEPSRKPTKDSTLLIDKQ